MQSLTLVKNPFDLALQVPLKILSSLASPASKFKNALFCNQYKHMVTALYIEDKFLIEGYQMPKHMLKK